MIRPKEAGGTDEALLDRLLESVPLVRPSVARTVGIAAIGLAIWLGPVLALAIVLGPDDTFVQIGAFFAKAATVTFGGAYSVLAYVAQEAVERYGWLRPGEMLDGLGMAETTPGPLIQVVQFVGYLGAYRNPGALPPVVAGILASVLTTWVTYAPSFLWIFVGAPVDRVAARQRAASARRCPRSPRRSWAPCSTSRCGSESTCCSRRRPRSSRGRSICWCPRSDRSTGPRW